MLQLGIMKKQRRKHTAGFTAAVALEAIQEVWTMNAIAGKSLYGLLTFTEHQIDDSKG
jgi:hypothetical protein